MKSMKLFDILKAVGGICHEFSDCVIESVTTDSRNIPENSLFLALKGENFDGNAFVADAFNKGVLACIADKNSDVKPHKNLILVEDTGKALLDLGHYYRSLFCAKIVAITGSVGKTTTKEMIAAVLSESYNTMKTAGNLNNLIGLPKTLLVLDNSVDAAVLEMGMSELGEISAMSVAAQPHVGVITNVGVSHLETLKTRENILKAKMEITHGLSYNAPLIINIDNDLLSTVGSKELHIITYAIHNEKAHVRATDITSDGESTRFNIVTKKESYSAEIPCVGEHNVYNALAAFAVGKCFSMSDDAILRGLKNYTPSGMRQNVRKVGDITLVEDCYNASPDSMRAAVGTLAAMPAKGRRIAVLGDMLELGSISDDAHYGIGKLCADKNIDEVICVGEKAHFIRNGCNENGGHAKWFDRKSDAAAYLLDNVKGGDVLWFKASRGMRFEDIIKEFDR